MIMLTIVLLTVIICVPLYYIWYIDSVSLTIRKLHDAALLADPNKIDKVLKSKKSKRLSEYDRFIFTEHARILREYIATLNEDKEDAK